MSHPADREPVLMAPYDPTWPERFTREATHLHSAQQDAAPDFSLLADMHDDLADACLGHPITYSNRMLTIRTLTHLCGGDILTAENVERSRCSGNARLAGERPDRSKSQSMA